MLVATDIDDYLNGLAARWRPASRKVICTSFRSYLRFRTMLGDDSRNGVSIKDIADVLRHRDFNTARV
ncbi:hypothetical protein D3C81_1823020 [compost metagenome]